MRNKLLIFLAVLTASSAFGQYDSKGELRSRFRAGFMWYYTGLRPAKVEKVRKYDRLIFDVVYNDWSGDKDPFGNHWASIGFNTNLMFDIPLTKGNTVSIGVGVAHQLMRIRHDQVLTKYNSPDMTVLEEKTYQTFDKNVLMGNSFAIPLELRFHKESWKHFKFHIGGKIGYQANMYSKFIYGSGGNRDVVKDYGFPDLNPLVYGAHIRFGLRNWGLYGSYNFSPMFTSSQSTQLHQIQFGLSISLY